MKRRLKAFTLMEVCVVMIISGIVISMALYGYAVIDKQHLLLFSNQERLKEAKKLIFLLEKDFDESELIIKTSGGFRCLKGEIEPSEYFLSNSQLIRSQSEQFDSFGIVINKVELEGLISKEEVSDNEPIKSLVLQLEGIDHPFELRKTYSSAELNRAEDFF